MARCSRTKELEIHHKRRDGGNGLDNAEVLCQPCHKATATYGVPGNSPAPFSQEIKKQALERAKKQCECGRTGGCH